MYKIIVADDHPATLLGTVTFLKSLKHYIVESYQNGIGTLNGILQHEPDIAVIDISMPGMSGLEILSIVKMKKIRTKIILLTMQNEISVYFSAKENNFDGYVLKDNALSELQECINTVIMGGVYVSPSLKEILVIDEQPNKDELMSLLTNAEIKVLELVADFKSNKDIAKFLFISERTVEVHKRNISEKLKLPKGKNSLLQWVLKNFNVKNNQ